MKQRALTDAETEELLNLRSAVYKAERERDEWLRNKGHEIATLKPGDEIWDLSSLNKLGKVLSVTVRVGDRPVVDYWCTTDDWGTFGTADMTCRVGSREQALLNLRDGTHWEKRDFCVGGETWCVVRDGLHGAIVARVPMSDVELGAMAACVKARTDNYWEVKRGEVLGPEDVVEIGEIHVEAGEVQLLDVGSTWFDIAKLPPGTWALRAERKK